MTERDMADIVIEHAEKLLGEPLTLLDRNVWIGRYELDLLFIDRHGAKLIVELQRGSLDRYHLYKVLDYYDEYKRRHPDEFVEVLVVANLISPERKERLAKRGINYREIPEAVLLEYVQPSDSATPPAPSTRTVDERIKTRLDDMRPSSPTWFQEYLRTLDPQICMGIAKLPAIFQPFDNPDPWTVTAAVGTFWSRLRTEHPNYPSSRIFAMVTGSFSQLYASLLSARIGELTPDLLTRITAGFDPDLLTLIKLGYDEVLPLQFFLKRHAVVRRVAEACAADPQRLQRICEAHRTFWINCPDVLTDSLLQVFLELLGVCLASIVRELSEERWSAEQIPIGVDKNNRFITRPLAGDRQDLDHFYIHMSAVLALPTPVTVKLWPLEEPLLRQYIDDAFPSVADGFKVGTELLIHAYGNRAYVIDQPSEVVINSGDIKSIFVAEIPEYGIGYRVLYANGEFSLGRIQLSQDEQNFLCDHFSTHTILGFLTFATAGTVLEQVRQRGVSGNEFALVTAIVRDFLVCQEKETFYTGKAAKPLPRPASRPGVVIRYLPRFRIRYIGIRSTDYQNKRVEVTGHHVSGHLRQCRMATPGQLALAREFGIEVPEGFTFVRPHDRGAHAKTLYRSRSALQLLYS